MIYYDYLDNETRTDVFINQIYPVERSKKTILSFLIRDLPHYMIQGKQGSSFYEEKWTIVRYWYNHPTKYKGSKFESEILILVFSSFK